MKESASAKSSSVISPGYSGKALRASAIGAMGCLSMAAWVSAVATNQYPVGIHRRLAVVGLLESPRGMGMMREPNR